MAYYYDERYLLPLSHDEVVHGKAAILQKMYGDYEMKFSQARAFYMYMYAHPGKKLNFMGNELGHFREWDEKRELDWNLLEYPSHQEFREFMKALNRFYLEHPAFSAEDYTQEGFRWIECSASEQCVYAFERTGGKERIAAVFNFSDKEQEIELHIPGAADVSGIFASVDRGFSLERGQDTARGEGVEKGENKRKNGTFRFILAPFSAEYYMVKE